jgi:TM2 domain-containing membrane protein YozV
MLGSSVVGVNGLGVIVFLVSLAVVIWAIVDVARNPRLSSGAKAGWIIGLVVGTIIFPLLALIAAIVYLAAIRRRTGGG